jgi:glycosyltransferase involved in cell wall biosynthesis
VTILYFIPRYDSAALANAIHSEVIHEWRRQGIEAEILTLAAGQRRLSSTLEDGIMVHRLPVSAGSALKLANRALAPLLHYPYLAGAVQQCRQFLRDRRYDLMHIETAFPLGLVAALLPRELRPPLAVTLPGADIMAVPEFDYGYARFASVRALLPLVFRRAKLLRADSPQIRDLAISMGADAAKISAIPYNINDRCFPPQATELIRVRAEARRQIEAQHRLDPQRPIVLSLSRLHPFKGLSYLLEAMPGLQERGCFPQLLIVGPARHTPRFGDYGAFLRRRSVELGLSADVIFAGAVPQSNAMQYLAAADVLVVPSVAESFNRVTVEAAAVGTPTVVTRTTGVSAYVRARRAGVVVEPCAEQALSNGILLLLRDRALWHNCSACARTMAADFSSTRIAAALLALYQPYVGTFSGVAALTK